MTQPDNRKSPGRQYYKHTKVEQVKDLLANGLADSLLKINENFEISVEEHGVSIELFGVSINILVEPAENNQVQFHILDQENRTMFCYPESRALMAGPSEEEFSFELYAACSILPILEQKFEHEGTGRSVNWMMKSKKKVAFLRA